MEENKEKKEIRVKLSTVLFIVLLVAVAVMAFFIYKLNDDNMKLKDQLNNKPDIVNTTPNTNTVSNDVNTNSNTNASNVAQTKKVNKIDNEKELVYTSFNEITSDYSYSLPFINIDSTDAKKINAEIESKFKTKSGYAIKYVSYVNDNVLSLVISNEFDGGFIEYFSYNIDIYTGKALSNKDLISLKNITETTYLSKLKEAYKNKYIKMYGTKDKISNGQSGITLEEYQAQYDKTVADKNISIETPLYLNSNGKLCNIGRIYSLAGADAYNYEIELDF